ncbi:hypothetical protein MKX78_19760 [Cytobacillus sp. FSL R5-0569]|uniref:hypothetical protein n=1 Tax=unclassified Cytobacillus TaxID=2675268 RepID=UPI0030F8467E
MKKRFLFLTLILGLGIFLAACGSDNTKVSDDDSTSGADQNEDSKEEDKSEQKSTDEADDVQEDADTKVTNTFTNKELDISGTSGPLNYEISAIQLKEIEIKSESAATMFEKSVGDTVQAITIEMSGENTSEEDMSFYLGQATIITDTKEQLEPDMFLSEHIDGEYLGQVQHEGHNVYILNKSNVSDIKSIEVRIGAPVDSNFDAKGEDVVETIEVNN